jgi:hypothetical protein
MAMFFLAISTIFAVLPVTGGAGTGTVTLTPSNAAPGGTVTVAGTGFASTQAIGIGIGNEVAVANESHPIANPTGTGPFNAVCAYKPVKVGSFYFHCVVSSDTNVVESNYWDAGDGTMTSDSTYALNPVCNYAAGTCGRSTTSAWDGYTVVFTVSYTHYQWGVTPAANVTTSSTGAFSTSITIPSNITAGTYTVTVVDAKGTKGTAQLTVSGPPVPEGFSVGLIVALLATVVIATRFFRKQPKTSLLAISSK